MAEAQHTTADAAACCTEFFSAHVESLRGALSTVDMNDKEARVEVEIETSKVHWSELTSAYVTGGEVRAMESTSPSAAESEGRREVETVAERNERVAKDNVEVFRSLQARYPGGFFVDETDLGPDHVQKLPRWMVDDDGKPLLVDDDGKPLSWEVKLSSEKPFAEGAQAQLFHAHAVFRDGKRWGDLVMKVFKEGTSLRDLQRLLPRSMLTDTQLQDEGAFDIAGCNVIGGARLLKADGRFAFLMARAWGDLRKLIDVRMLHNNNQGAPFADDIAPWCMFCVAKGMQSLHAKGIVHRDLKAANVLLFNLTLEANWKDIDPFNLEPRNFGCLVADFECSIGVVGTRFWRAPEILLALKNRNVHEHLKIFSKQADVYSFGMTCYEILTGRIPLEELVGSDYDGVIGGARPILPKETPPWMVDMVKRCWEHDPSMRPIFDEIVELISSHRIGRYTLTMNK